MISFDRDGTLIGKLDDFNANHPKHIKKPSDQILIPEVEKVIKKTNKPICIASNQGGVHGTIAYTSLEAVAEQFQYLNQQLPVALALFCTDNSGERCFAVQGQKFWEIGLEFPELIGTYRKPNGGMLKIIRRLYPAESHLYVGDLETDELAAKAANFNFLYVNQFLYL